MPTQLSTHDLPPDVAERLREIEAYIDYLISLLADTPASPTGVGDLFWGLNRN
jgi:hypothetical protein